MFDPSIPRPLQDQVQNELESGEILKWIAMPRPAFFTRASTPAFLFAIPWTAFAIFWTGAATWSIVQAEERDPWMMLFPLFGTPFVMIGLTLLSSPLWTLRNSLRTVYAITDRRAITFESGWGTTVRSYKPERLKDVFRTERSDGSGDLILSHRRYRDSEGNSQRLQVGFFRVENVREVEGLIRALAEKADSGAS